MRTALQNPSDFWRTEERSFDVVVLGKCRKCKQGHRQVTTRTVKRTFRADMPFPVSTHRSESPALRPVTCCGRTVAMGEVHGHKTEEPCGAKCTGATGHQCECSCGGKNHGAGWAGGAM